MPPVLPLPDDQERLFTFAITPIGKRAIQIGGINRSLAAGIPVVTYNTLDAASQWSIDRETGARRAFAEYPGINVLNTVNTGAEPQEIYAAVENAMLANPSVTGALSLECCSVPALGEYVKRNGLQGQVTVVGFDELPTTLDLIKNGFIAASISQAPDFSVQVIHLLLMLPYIDRAFETLRDTIGEPYACFCHAGYG